MENVLLKIQDKKLKIVPNMRCPECGSVTAIIRKDAPGAFMGMFECDQCGHSEPVHIIYDRARNLAYLDGRHLNRKGGVNL